MIFRYIMRSHILFIALCSLILASLLSAIFLVELLRIPDRPSQVWELMLWKFPSLFSFSLPFSVFGGIFVSYYFMKIRNELMAFPSIGFEGGFLVKNSIPVFLLISLFHILFMEVIVVKAEKRFLIIKSLYKDEVAFPRTDYWAKRKNFIFHFGNIFPEKNLILDVEVVSVEGGKITSFIKGKRGRIYEDKIVLENVKIYKPGFPEGITDVYEIPGGGILLEKKFSESEIFALSISELYKMKSILEKEGLDTSLYRNFIWTKMTFPAFSFLGGISSIGIPYMGSVLTFLPFLKSFGFFFLFFLSIYLTLALCFKGFIHPIFVPALVLFYSGIMVYFLKKFSMKKI
jgi:lipopolysaccharide export LptBFGC system permease protein LptF